MHICYICNEYPPASHGGIGSMVQALSRSLVARGHAVTVVGIYSPESQGRSLDEGVEVIRLPHTRMRGTGLLVNGSRLREALVRIHRQRPIDLLEGSELSFAFTPRTLPFPTLIRMNGGHHFFAVTLGEEPRPWRSWLERRSFSRATHLCAVSRYVASTTSRLLGLDGREIEIIPNPVDVVHFFPRQPSTEEASLIVFVGTVCEKKGIRQLIEAMPRIVEYVPDARLLVCGRDSIDPKSGRSFSLQLQQTLPAGVADRVSFTGHVNHASLPDTLARAAVCVYPSHMEALPLAWLEGLAMGKAVVASSTGPGPEVIEDGVSGLLCDPHDPAAIAARIIAVLGDHELRKRLGEDARRDVMTRFSLSTLVARNETFYERVRDRSAPQTRARPRVLSEVS